MKAGFVSLIGRPNAGKSTLLNRFVGQKVAIVSDKPQTTRHRIVGVHNRPDRDTGGSHAAVVAGEGYREAIRTHLRATTDRATPRLENTSFRGKAAVVLNGYDCAIPGFTRLVTDFQ